MYIICQLRPDGGVTTVSLSDASLENAQRFVQDNGGEVISSTLHAAIVRGDVTEGVPVTSFKKKIALLYLKLGEKEEVIQKKWDRVFRLLDAFTVVYPDQQPLSGLLDAAVADGLLTSEEAVELRGTTHSVEGDTFTRERG